MPGRIIYYFIVWQFLASGPDFIGGGTTNALTDGRGTAGRRISGGGYWGTALNQNRSGLTLDFSEEYNFFGPGELTEAVACWK
jgi:hypothetical protein